MMRFICIVSVWWLVTLQAVVGQTVVGQAIVGTLAAQDSKESLKALSEFIAKRDCNSSNCHGSKVPEERLAVRAGDLWELYDPHSNAYLSLRTDQSLAIVRKLWTSTDAQGLSVDSPEYHRFLENNCVSCHASESAPVTQRSAGVDCQSCHGSATAWGDSHLLQSWRDKKEKRFEEISPDDPAAKGRINTSSPWILANRCGSCHVGELSRSGNIEFDDGSSVPKQPREVSHQLMAAGHPPTYFEFGHYLRRYPKHWRDLDNVAGPKGSQKDDQTIGSSIQGRSLDTWRVGKIVNAHQRLELLANRLNSSEWPELTEHRCTSCHHPASPAIEPDNKHQSKAFAQWDGWYLEQVDLALAITQPLADANGDSDSSKTAKLWSQHYKSLQVLLLNPLSAHQPQTKSRIAEEIAALERILKHVIVNQLPMIEPNQIQRVRVDWVEQVLSSASDSSWESAVQIKLAAIALGHAKNPSGEYPAFGNNPWDLPNEVWRRSEPMPYAASSSFVWPRFYEHLQELKKSLD